MLGIIIIAIVVCVLGGLLGARLKKRRAAIRELSRRATERTKNYEEYEHWNHPC